MKILLAADESKFSDAATNAVIAQIKAEGTEVYLLHVIEPFPEHQAEKNGTAESPDFVAARLQLREYAKKLLSRATRKLRSAGFEVTSCVEEGDARDAILNRAESWRADLIVVGSHGRKGLDRFLIGSVSEAVARQARCSVEIVRIQPADRASVFGEGFASRRYQKGGPEASMPNGNEHTQNTP
jgi:nucleotide-binding universal stress UspA family protein